MTKKAQRLFGTESIPERRTERLSEFALFKPAYNLGNEFKR